MSKRNVLVCMGQTGHSTAYIYRDIPDPDDEKILAVTGVPDTISDFDVIQAVNAHANRLREMTKIEYDELSHYQIKS